jgi:methyltransferase (TIGR00027 family)
MSERSSSTTALRVAQLRAVHQLLDGEPKILVDPVSVRLFGDEVRARLQNEGAKLNEPWVTGLRSHVLLRSRYAEDRLAAAYEHGVRQYVLLGAGYDTFAYRQPEWAHGLRIFEVDHPASQRQKQERLRSAGVEVPSNLEFVSIDFEHVSLRDGLAASGLESNLPAFFACLGVLVYLTPEAADAVFACVASFPESSEIVFTYSAPTSSLTPEEAARRAAIGKVTDSMGEPWRTFFDPETLAQKLRDAGFSKVSFLKTADAEAKYYQGRSDGLRVPKREPVVSAVVGTR